MGSTPRWVSAVESRRSCDGDTAGHHAISVDGNRITVEATITEARARNEGASAGDTKGTLISAATGAVAGTAIALGTSGSDAVIDVGSGLRFRFDKPFNVRRRAA